MLFLRSLDAFEVSDRGLNGHLSGRRIRAGTKGRELGLSLPTITTTTTISIFNITTKRLSSPFPTSPLITFAPIVLPLPHSKDRMRTTLSFPRNHPPLGNHLNALMLELVFPPGRLSTAFVADLRIDGFLNEPIGIQAGGCLLVFAFHIVAFIPAVTFSINVNCTTRIEPSSVTASCDPPRRKRRRASYGPDASNAGGSWRWLKESEPAYGVLGREEINYGETGLWSGRGNEGDERHSGGEELTPFESYSSFDLPPYKDVRSGRSFVKWA
ncbi:hypothetical protein ONZ45_g16662 [Pleurotus djamor]|nr:hypothetical protein ONZ45_g16662 [Pleurotus djamor]